MVVTRINGRCLRKSALLYSRVRKAKTRGLRANYLRCNHNPGPATHFIFPVSHLHTGNRGLCTFSRAGKRRANVVEDEREGERDPKVRGCTKCANLRMTPLFLGRTAALSNGTQATGLMLSGRLLGLAVWVVKAGRQEREEELSGPKRVGGPPAASSSSSGMKPVPKRPHKSAPGDQTDFPLHLLSWMVQYEVWNAKCV